MSREEIVKVLKEACAFDGNFGHINTCPQCEGMSRHEYLVDHYPKMCKLLESLPWTKVVKNPRNPQPGEYPSEDGNYLVMLDCDEHAVLKNRFSDGHWTLYNRTHVKWWMPWDHNSNSM